MNKPASYYQIGPEQTGDSWRLTLSGQDRPPIALSREELLGMTQHTYRLSIACVEGWSTEQTWTGVPLSDLAGLVGARQADTALVQSIQSGGAFSSAMIAGSQLRDPRCLLALSVNGEPLSLDHGYPAA